MNSSIVSDTQCREALPPRQCGVAYSKHGKGTLACPPRTYTASQTPVTEEYCGIVVVNEEDFRPVTEDDVKRVANVLELFMHRKQRATVEVAARAAIQAMPDEGRLQTEISMLKAEIARCPKFQAISKDEGLR